MGLPLCPSVFSPPLIAAAWCYAARVHEDGTSSRDGLSVCTTMWFVAELRGGHRDRLPGLVSEWMLPVCVHQGQEVGTTIWAHRVQFLEERALPQWEAFTIWNAGRQGRRLYRSLTAASRRKVVAFCDVDENKIRKGVYCYEDSQERPKPCVPILHFRAARPPFVICVKLDLTGGAFEENLRSLNLQEGRDFLHFS
ncbi:PREDICTED: UDP-GlcNAc:betaGal beta-1,3-N-acetylglucosaminyltransferase-like protein 1 [Galeopterus variegatus]|uniref:UDP-GlcNAc:betaGal beta-1,3-N-acetylglucosaminyltransferase-like protein 1 n=1 Tax=Galeopterus variegatus TaxID=482537 RepID=A0ABM0S0X4_GALVR|nr:PREDICTED: UDP-GlcNAc:betaGal beta-1,3-N-acetylglucosaminyltransferase-like protein 1 [Galeopterus variegatus]